MSKNVKRKEIITIIVLFLCSIAISVIGAHNGQDWGGDFSQYIAQARAIDTNTIDDWLHKNQWIIDNSSPGLGSIAYPWLFPIMISPVYHLFGLNFVPYQVFLSVIFAFSVTAFYIFLRRRTISAKVALIFSALLIVNGEYLVLTKKILSDLPCFMFTVFSWIAIERYISKRTWKRALLVGFLGFLAFFARTMGAAILVSLVLIDILNIKQLTKQGKRTILTSCLPYICFVLLWLIGGYVFPKGGASYTSYFSVTLQQCADNIQYYGKIIWDFIYQSQLNDNISVKMLFIIVFLPVIAIIILGFIKRLLEKDYLALYVLVSLIMLCLYNYTQGTRFILSVFPVLYVFAYYGFKAFVDSRKEKIAALVLGSVVCVISLGCSAMYTYSTLVSPVINDVSSDSALEVYQYINNEISKDNVIYFGKPRVLYLYTGVYSYRISGNLSFENMKKADYVLRAQSLDNYALDNLLNTSEEHFQLIYMNNDFQLYKVLHTDVT